MKKLFSLLIVLILILCFSLNTDVNAATKKKKVGYVNITYETKDSFVIKSKLFYPAKESATYPLVVMLHSLGYSGEYWYPLSKKLVDNGAAVLIVDLRGHATSSYDSNFKIKSWHHYSDKDFVLYPDDITEILKYINSNYKNVSSTDYAIIGADIGANTAVLTADQMVNKPKSLVLISLTRNFKGLYVPMALANIGPVPILSISSVQDKYSHSEGEFLKRFAQGEYDIKSYPSGGMGMMMLKVNPKMSDDIVNWLLPKIGISTPVIEK